MSDCVLYFAGVIFNSQKDVMLGSVQIPLADLINKRTGMFSSIT